jgi:hypothetical protein
VIRAGLEFLGFVGIMLMLVGITWREDDHAADG